MTNNEDRYMKKACSNDIAFWLMRTWLLSIVFFHLWFNNVPLITKKTKTRQNPKKKNLQGN
jgi:hypothetical protein